MKMIFSTTLIFFIIFGAEAQTKSRFDTIESKKTTVQTPLKISKLTPAEPKTPPPVSPPPPATNKTAGTVSQNTSVYTLTSARVHIKTGTDNKEFPSGVHVTLMANSTPENWRNYIQIQLSNEMRTNSDTEFGLDLEGRAPTPLETFQRGGLTLRIHYTPNFFADAWKIESVSVDLEFKDQNGNLHPSLGRKTIVFSNAYGFLNNEFRYMKCFTDESFSPLTAVISKTY